MESDKVILMWPDCLEAAELNEVLIKSHVW